MKPLYILTIAAGLLSLGACSEKLNIDEHGVLPIDKFYKTDEQVSQANATSYYAFTVNSASQWAGSFEYYYIALNSMLSDEAWSGGESRGDFADGEKLNEYNFGIENPIISNYYTDLYQMIYRANIVLDKTTQGQSPFVDMCRAEALVFRSWANFELASMWGNAPLVTHPLESNEYQVSNSQPGELWAAIEADLKAAINSGTLSQKKSLDDKTTWRITKEFAEALLGKALLWQGKYSDAIPYLKDVADSPLYGLFEGEYADIWRMANKFNRESLFELNRVGDMNNRRVCQMYVFFSWRTQYFSSLPPEMQTTGWGWMVPQKSLYDDFVAYEGENSYRRRGSLLTWEEVRDEHNTRISNGSTVYQDKYFGWKYRFLTEDTLGGMFNYCISNFHVMRLAEVYLLLAEAYVQSGQPDAALPYVNAIRRRAKLQDLSSCNLETIKMEKKLELCFEEIRYKDLIRWGDAENVLKNQGESIPFSTSVWESPNSTDATKDVLTVDYRHYYTSPDQYGFKKGKHELLPYPQSEILSNPNIDQNPGY